MVYDSSQVGRQDVDVTDPMGPRFSGEPGFRDEPDFRGQSTYQIAAYQQPADGRTVPPAALDDVFDDPADGDPGQDRLGVHWAWEVVLLLGVGVLAVLIWQADPNALRGGNLSELLVLMTGYSLLGIAAGVTLRAGAPNLAIGPVAVAAGVYFAQRGADGVAVPTGIALVAATALGVALAVLVVGFHVPGWAASLAASAGVLVWLIQQPPQVPLSGEYDPTGEAAFLFVLVAALAIAGGLLGTLRPVRRAIGRFRPVGDPASRRGVVAVLLTGGATLLSMIFAVVAGVILAAGAGVPVEAGGGTRWLELTVIGLAVALLGGTSAFGRRGGVFGTVLAALGLVLFDLYQQQQGWGVAVLATGTAALVVGLAVTRLVERFGRPRSADEGDAWASSPAPARAADGWAPGPDSWASSLPAQPAQDHPHPWDDRWGR